MRQIDVFLQAAAVRRRQRIALEAAIGRLVQHAQAKVFMEQMKALED